MASDGLLVGLPAEAHDSADLVAAIAIHFSYVS
jgi:hypothetical protein